MINCQRLTNLPHAAKAFIYPKMQKRSLDNIPQSDNINVLFDHIDSQRVNPADDRVLHFLKTTLLYSLDLFRTSYLPLTNQGERDNVEDLDNYRLGI